ncbi:DUF1579 domain-containing protein [Flavihumibacter sediminis]|nr:DUF1579 domain-containing protein [Flavihumibacter sediminis]
MKKLLFCCIALFFFAAIAHGQTPSQDDQMKVFRDYMTPGEWHKKLAKDDGEWKAEVSMWMDPSQPPTKSTAKMINKMILGGRYQESRFTGEFMGMPMEGIGTIAYDNTRKIFLSTWIDNLGTGMMYMEGKWDEATKSIILEGESLDPMLGKMVKIKETFKYIDDNNQLMEMFMIQDGKEIKTMEIKLTRS